jgi:hypothetical protein
LQDDPSRGRQTYDLLREGVDYVMDPSNLWFALVRPLNETSERLVVAYNVRINGRDTVWVTTGGTPDIKATGREQVANLVMDPTVGPSSPAFRREIRSVYRVAGEDLIRRKTRVRIVAGSGLLERPLAGSDATFLQMFGLSRAMNAAEFDAENRLWPRVSDPIFNLSAGAADVRNGQTTDPSRLIRDYFLVFPSTRPFAERTSGGGGGLVVPGNPSNDAIYTIAGEYLYSPQHPPSLYRVHLDYETAGTEETGTLMLGATQMRAGSERVAVDGRSLTRDLDYTIDYDLGRIEFTHSDTLLRQQRRVEVRYEENPVFLPTPTTLGGLVAELPVRNGVLNFTAINQSQSTLATRPALGFQGSSSLTTGISGQFNWNAPALTNLVNRLPFASSSTTPSRISLQGEVATSHPQFLARNQGTAWVEVFEGGGGITLPLSDLSWDYASLPAYGNSLRGVFGPATFEPNRASTLVWQTTGRTASGGISVFTRRQIDSLTTLFGSGREPTEPVMWLTLLPLSQGGRYRPDLRRFDWTIPNTVPGRRFRSIRATLSPSGLDLTRGEHLEFWALVDTSTARRSANPTLVFDFGDISENSLTFAPETLTIRRNPNGTIDSVFTGKRRQGADRLDSERDPYSHAFNYEVNDKGLPGDVADTLVVIDGATVRREHNVATCRYALNTVEFLGNPRANCTVDNNRLNEEDIDLDNTLNLTDAGRERERLLRYVIDLSDKARYRRVGGSHTDTMVVGGVSRVRTRQWVLVSAAFDNPTDSLGDVNRRRMRAVRLTVVSGMGQDDNEALQFPIADIRVTGAPWLNRANTLLTGVAGTRPGGGFVITSQIGTTDSSATLVYQPPPGVTDEPEFRVPGTGQIRTAINEHSMRIQAGGNIPVFSRTESYLRFPAGPQDYLISKRLRVWGRGRGNGWGQNGELQMFVKIGRDENNFYLYRAPLESGSTQAAWTDLSIDFNRFIALRKQIQADYLAGKPGSVACTGVDSAIVAASLQPMSSSASARRFAACDGGYMVYTLDPAVTAPNLSAVQELAAGLIRVANGGGASPIAPGDTLELWVDDMRLEEPQNVMGVAGQVSVELNAADLGDLRLRFSNRDPNFRQVGEAPTFLGERNLDISGTLHLEKMLPQRWGIALPLTINKFSLANDPLYLSRSDISGRVPGVRKPKSDLTTYSLSVRRSTPLEGGVLAPIVNNLSLTSSLTTGVDRTEYQDGKARTFNVSVDYLVAGDEARVVRAPWLDEWLGALRWNPTHFRVSSGLVRSTDRRVSFIKPANAQDEQPAVSDALTRLWRGGSTLEFRPTNSVIARWELQSIRDLRDYGDTSALSAVATRQRSSWLGANAGFERERSVFTNLSWTPVLRPWLLPRAELGTQYSMLRDPNARSLVALPGVLAVDSVLFVRDSIAAASSLTLARRMTAAQTASAGAQIDLAQLIGVAGDSSSLRPRVGRIFAPLDVSYTRSLLAALDAAPVDAPLGLQFGLGGPGSFRMVNGVPATTSGRTGMFNAAGTVLLPFGTSIVNRFSRTATDNWIARPDGSQAQVDGTQRQFPDVALRWSRRSAAATSFIRNVDASAGYVRTNARVTLPNLLADEPPELRRSNVQSFPISGTVAWGLGGGMTTSAKYSVRRSLDSLPGSVARAYGTDVGFDAARTFRVPASWQLGIRDDLRTRFGFQQSHNTTSILDSVGVVRARLQDNGRKAFTFTADANVNEFVVLAANGSHIITFDNTLNRRIAYTVFSLSAQMQFYGAGR